jgi:hypothetical protein
MIYVLNGLDELCFNCLCFKWVSLVKLSFSWLCFEWVLVVELGYNGLCFEWVSMVKLSLSGLCFSGLYHAFQAETWVGLRWCAHNNLYKLNAIYFGMINYVLEIIVSCLYCLVWLQESMAKHKDIFVPLACKKNLAETNVH